MIQNVDLRCIKVKADPVNYLPTIYTFAGMVRFFSENNRAPEARSL